MPMRWWEQNPDLPPIGRQPAAVQIAPSKTYPWYGSIVGGVRDDVAVSGGERFTTGQDYALKQRGLDAASVPTMIVKRQATLEDLWFPLGEMPPVFAMECPVIGKHGEKTRVIAPNGDAKLVRADGWALKPKTRPRQATDQFW